MPSPPTPPVASAEHAAFRALERFSCLDGLRCLSILAVIWHHASIDVAGLPGSQRGFLGVDLFFVISGFLIVTLLLRERERRGSISLRQFYARRTLRIFPAYYATLLGLACLYALAGEGSERAALYFAELPSYLTYTSNWFDVAIFGISWSLATEEQFYLFWPPIERFARRWVWPALIALIAVSQFANFARDGAVFEMVFGADARALDIMQVTFTPIALGVALAHALHDPRSFAWLFRVAGGRFAAPAWLAAVFAIANIPAADISGAQRLALHLAMTMLVASTTLRDGNALRSLLTLPWIARIGVVSYGMYLFHLFAMAAIQRAAPGLPGALLFGATVAATWLVAEASFRWFEAPFLRMKERLGSRG